MSSMLPYSHLTPYKETTTNGTQYQEPILDLVDGQPEWEVDQILGAIWHQNQLQYIVRWKGFSDAYDSWEPLTHIKADEFITEFYWKQPMAAHNINKTLLLPHWPHLSQSIKSQCLPHLLMIPSSLVMVPPPNLPESPPLSPRVIPTPIISHSPSLWQDQQHTSTPHPHWMHWLTRQMSLLSCTSNLHCTVMPS